MVVVWVEGVLYISIMYRYVWLSGYGVVLG